MSFDLKAAQEFYINNLLNKNYVFETDEGRFVFKFEESNFCHLIGLHYFDSSYQGMHGWKMIENDKITHKILKNLNKNTFETTYKPRIKTLYKIESILANCMSIRKYKQIGNRKFNCDLFVYNDKEKTYDIVSFFLDMETKEFFAGSSLLQFSKNDKYVISYINPLDKEIEIKERYIQKSKIKNSINQDFLKDILKNNK